MLVHGIKLRDFQCIFQPQFPTEVMKIIRRKSRIITSCIPQSAAFRVNSRPTFSNLQCFDICVRIYELHVQTEFCLFLFDSIATGRLFTRISLTGKDYQTYHAFINKQSHKNPRNDEWKTRVRHKIDELSIRIQTKLSEI